MSAAERDPAEILAEIDAAPPEPPIHDRFVQLDVIDDDDTGEAVTVFFDDRRIDEQEGLYIRVIGGGTVDLEEVR